MRPPPPRILVLTGASGVGKTAATHVLEARGREGLRCYRFDTIGIPSWEVMERDFGGPAAWQADATHRWFARIAREADGSSTALLDGQTRPSFVRGAAEAIGRAVVRIVLVECTPEVRLKRLTDRGHAWLANPQMDAWAVYLREQAGALHLPVIDTTEMSLDAVADALTIELDLLESGAGNAGP